jgi:hypothetical protein
VRFKEEGGINMNGQETGMPEGPPGPFAEPEEKGFPIGKDDIKPISQDKKMKMIKLLMLALGVLFVILVGLLLVSYVRFASLKSECQQKLDYWTSKPGCVDTIPNNMPNITVPIRPTPRLPNRTNESNDTVMVTFE